MNSRLAGLQSYPFEKLAQLIHGITPPRGKAPIRLSVGEPQHAAPAFVLEALKSDLADLSRTAQGTNPGQNRVRLALVAPLNECVEAAQRIRNYVESL